MCDFKMGFVLLLGAALWMGAGSNMGLYLIWSSVSDAVL
jgi:hypothetical protein